MGQTFAALICPHLPWEWIFYSFGGLGVAWLFLWLIFYNDHVDETCSSDGAEVPLMSPPKVKTVNRSSVHWSRFFRHWSFWAIYAAHFSMNWTNYIIMQWLPTYLVTTLGANRESISLTAVPYLVNSFAGICE